MTNRKLSQQWFERAQQSLVEGVNSPSRGAAVYSPGPVFLERGQGSHVWDADGNEYIDFMMSFGALIQGHAHSKIVQVVSHAMAEGSHFAAATSAEVEAAERFRRMVPPAEAVRFTNTGSEATMLALRLARAHTRRTKFLKFEGHYHGWYDPYLLNAHSHAPEQLGPLDSPARIPDSEGIPASTFDDVVLAPWNDVAALERIMLHHGHELAAVITEPIMANMGCILPRDGYLQRLCELTREYGVLLILDEVVTGFRYAPGGSQEYYGVTPDISTFGKALGAGFSVGAVAGPRSILDRLRWSEHIVLHDGTRHISEIAWHRRCSHRGLAGSLSVPQNKGHRARFRAHVPDLLHRAPCHPRLPRLLHFCGYAALFPFRSPAARARHLHDSLERTALDHLHRAHGKRRDGADRGGGPGLC